MKALRYRNCLTTHSKVPGTIRIVCLGDSYTYGFGVSADKTFSAQLEAILRSGVWGASIEVLNEGINAMALYEAVYEYERHVHRYRPDILILTLCNNDAQFCNPGAGDYNEIQRSNWIHARDYLRIALTRLAELVRPSSTKVVIACLNYPDSPIHAAQIETLKPICTDLSFGFVDLQEAFFRRPGDPYQGSELRVSTVDAHPSEKAHSLAAHHLARYLLSGRFIEPSPASDQSELAILEQARENLTRSIEHGYSVEGSCQRTLAIYDAVHNHRRRGTLPKESILSNEKFAEIRKALADELEALVAARRVEAYLAFLRDRSALIAAHQELVEREQRDLHLKLFFAEHFRECPSASQLIPDLRDMAPHERLPMLGQVAAMASSQLELLAKLVDDTARHERSGNGGLSAELTGAARELRAQFLDDIYSLGTSTNELVQRVNRAVAAKDGGSVFPIELGNRLCIVIHAYLQLLLDLALPAVRIGQPVSLGDFTPRFTVRGRKTEPQPIWIRLRLDSIVPSLLPYQEEAFLAPEPAMFSFSLPQFFYGTLTFSVHSENPNLNLAEAVEFEGQRLEFLGWQQTWTHTRVDADGTIRFGELLF